MKLYECLKEVIEEKKLFKMEVKTIFRTGRMGIYYIEGNRLFKWRDNRFYLDVTNIIFAIVYEDIELLDPELEENKPYYEAMEKVVK